MTKIEWDNEKNELLKSTRGVCFEDVEQAILDDKVLDIVPHFNKKRYPKQEILVVLLRGYVYYVPFVQENDKLFFKIIVPSRKLNKLYNTKD